MPKGNSMTPIEMHEPKKLVQNFVVKPPEEEKNHKRGFCSPVRAFLGFGFIFGLNFCGKLSKSNSIRLIINVVCLIIWLWPWFVLYIVFQANYVCYQHRTSVVKKESQCVDNYFIFNYVTDAVLGIVCSTGLLINRNTIAQLFDEILEIFEKSKTEKTDKSKEIKNYKLKMGILSGFMIFFCIFIPTVAVLANGGLEIVKLTGSKKMPFILSVIRNIPTEILTTYFCMMYALVCYILNVHLSMLQKHAATSKYPDFNADSYKLQRMIRLAEASFNQILPLVYFLKISTVISFFLRFNQEVKPMTSLPHYFRFGLLFLHALQLLLIIIPPSLFNNRVDLPIQHPVVSTVRDHPIGVYSVRISYERSVSNSEGGTVMYLTVGGFPISLWILALAIAAGMIAVVIENNITVFLRNFETSVNAQFKKLIPPPPKACPIYTCPTCAPAICSAANATTTFDQNSTSTKMMNTDIASTSVQTTTTTVSLAENYTSSSNENTTAISSG